MSAKVKNWWSQTYITTPAFGVLEGKSNCAFAYGLLQGRILGTLEDLRKPSVSFLSCLSVFPSVRME